MLVGSHSDDSAAVRVIWSLVDTEWTRTSAAFISVTDAGEQVITSADGFTASLADLWQTHALQLHARQSQASVPKVYADLLRTERSTLGLPLAPQETSFPPPPTPSAFTYSPPVALPVERPQRQRSYRGLLLSLFLVGASAAGLYGWQNQEQLPELKAKLMQQDWVKRLVGNLITE
jgi:hypothetical protein